MADELEDAITDLGLVLGEIPTLSEILAEYRPAWMRDAACAEHDRAVFFPTSPRPNNAAKAKAICAGCPVRGDCLDYALADPTLDGIWSGTSKADRRAIRSGHARPGAA